MRKHNYLASFTPTDDQLLKSTIDAWTSYSENKQKYNSKSSNMIEWKCIHCSKIIKVHYKHANARNMYCNKCRPHIVKKNSIMFRYLIMFRNHVHALLIHNTNVKL